jgi:hypothetical protein
MLKTLIIAAGIVAVTAWGISSALTSYFRPPLEIYSMEVLNSPVKPGARVLFKQVLRKTKDCPAKWDLLVTDLDQRSVSSKTVLGGNVRAQPKVVSVVVAYDLPTDIQPGFYIFKEYGRFSCNPFDVDYDILGPDAVFEVN